MLTTPIVARFHKLDGFKLGDRNVEARPQAILQTANNLPFIFERLRRFDVQFESEKGDQKQFPVSSS